MHFYFNQTSTSCHAHFEFTDIYGTKLIPRQIPDIAWHCVTPLAQLYHVSIAKLMQNKCFSFAEQVKASRESVQHEQIMVKPDVGRQAADGCRVPHTWLVATSGDPLLHITRYETSLILFLIDGQEKYRTQPGYYQHHHRLIHRFLM